MRLTGNRRCSGCRHIGDCVARGLKVKKGGLQSILRTPPHKHTHRHLHAQPTPPSVGERMLQLKAWLTSGCSFYVLLHPQYHLRMHMLACRHVSSVHVNTNCTSCTQTHTDNCQPVSLYTLWCKTQNNGSLTWTTCCEQKHTFPYMVWIWWHLWRVLYTV